MANRRTLKKRKLYKKIDESELWDLGLTISNFIIPRLEKFRDTCFSVPLKKIENNKPIAMSEDEWKEILNKTIWSFNYQRELSNGDILLRGENEEDIIKYEEGLDLFKRYLNDLWT